MYINIEREKEKHISTLTHFNAMIIYDIHVSHDTKTSYTFHYIGWLIEILIMVYHNPYITG